MKLPEHMKSATDSPTEEMKEYIPSLARELNLDTGHALPVRVLFHRTISFNPKQRDALEPAINELISDGIFEERNNTAFLTKSGRDLLY